MTLLVTYVTVDSCPEKATMLCLPNDALWAPVLPHSFPSVPPKCLTSHLPDCLPRLLWGRPPLH